MCAVGIRTVNHRVFLFPFKSAVFYFLLYVIVVFPVSSYKCCVSCFLLYVTVVFPVSCRDAPLKLPYV